MGTAHSIIVGIRVEALAYLREYLDTVDLGHFRDLALQLFPDSLGYSFGITVLEPIDENAGYEGSEQLSVVFDDEILRERFDNLADV
jgi:hypothetical protein